MGGLPSFLLFSFALIFNVNGFFLLQCILTVSSLFLAFLSLLVSACSCVFGNILEGFSISISDY